MQTINERQSAFLSGKVTNIGDGILVKLDEPIEVIANKTKDGLVRGGIYTVTEVTMRGWSTELTIDEVPWFVNSVHTNINHEPFVRRFFKGIRKV